MTINSSEISVIIPAYNAAAFLSEAITSVLSQECLPGEVIVVDDGSTDDTAAIAMSFAPQVRLLTQPNAGPGAARNLGVRNARGTMLAFLDSDDLWLPDKLKLQLAALNGNPELSMVFGRVEIIQPSDSSDITKDETSVYEGIHAGAMLILREAFLNAGYFTPEICIGDFLDWYARAIDIGLKSLVLPDVVMKRRLHERNLTRMKESQSRAAYLSVLRTALHRRQEASVISGCE
jgi:glycosyltransferase involved in cell wall biosynthesis